MIEVGVHDEGHPLSSHLDGKDVSQLQNHVIVKLEGVAKGGGATLGMTKPTFS